MASEGGNSIIQVDPQWTSSLKKCSNHVLVEDGLDLSMESRALHSFLYL